MSSTAASPPGSAASRGLTEYWVGARRPLQVLAFLLPLIVAYELCLALLLPTGDGLRVNTVEAHKTLLTFFAAFGIAPTGGLYLGGLAIVVATGVPMLMHPGELFAAAVWFSMVTWLMLRTKNIWDCVAAHAVTNLLLGIYVMTTGHWELW